jgi:hypothetical protein
MIGVMARYVQLKLSRCAAQAQVCAVSVAGLLHLARDSHFMA